MRVWYFGPVDMDRLGRSGCAIGRGTSASCCGGHIWSHVCHRNSESSDDLSGMSHLLWGATGPTERGGCTLFFVIQESAVFFHTGWTRPIYTL